MSLSCTKVYGIPMAFVILTLTPLTSVGEGQRQDYVPESDAHVYKNMEKRLARLPHALFLGKKFCPAPVRIEAKKRFPMVK